MEFGADGVAGYEKEALVAAKESAGVEVVNISGALGVLYYNNITKP